MSSRSNKRIRRSKREWRRNLDTRVGEEPTSRPGLRAPHIPTKRITPRAWKQPKWHRDLFGPEMED